MRPKTTPLIVRWRDPNHRWTSTEAGNRPVDELRRSDLAALALKVKYFLKGGPNGLQFQPVEGGTSAEILDLMENMGIPRRAIERKLASGEGALGEAWRKSSKKRRG